MIYDIMSKNKEKFVELANSRVNKAIKFIKLVGNLSNRSHYTYTEQQVSQIISALDKEVKIIKNKFMDSSSDRERKDFELQ